MRLLLLLLLLLLHGDDGCLLMQLLPALSLRGGRVKQPCEIGLRALQESAGRRKGE